MEKVFFTVGYSMTRVTCPAEKKHVNAIIRKISTVIYEQWMRRKGQRPRVRQMFINLYRDAQFPSGLLEKVLPRLSPDEYVVVDQRQKPSRDPRLVFDPALFEKARWYQKEALAAIKEHKRLIVKEPTGSGKTMLAACAINAAGVKTLYIVPTIELLHQTAREFAGIFGRQNIGVIGDGMWAAHPAIVVATVQSLWSRYEDNVFFNTAFDGIGMLILDECHHVNVGNVFENTWFKIANRIPAYWRIGMSATPGEPNDKNRQLLEAATGLLRHETKTMDLVDQGFLVVPKPKFYTCKHERRYKNWVVAKGTGLSANEARNKMIATLALSAALKNKKVLIIVDRVETHGQVLYEMIGSNRSMFVYGNIDSASRLKAKREFESGRIPILIGTIYGEGVNMPKMDVVINAAGGKSSRVAIQRMGRVLRISEGKSEGVLIDFMDEDRGVLLEHSLARFQTYQDEGYEPEVLEYTE